MANPARIVIYQRHEIHLVQGVDTAWHQLDERCACDPVLEITGSPVNLWATLTHLHYGPEQEFETEEPS